jgi:predicted DNA-binding transcriptional regulator AlpA
MPRRVKTKSKPPRLKKVRPDGTACIKPRGLETRLGISPPTRWRWEKGGQLPPRDVFVGGRAIGWRPSTLEESERGPARA